MLLKNPPLKWKEWLIPSSGGYVVGDIERTQVSSIRKLLFKSQIWGIELDKSLHNDSSERFRLKIRQELREREEELLGYNRQCSMLGLYFKRHLNLSDSQEGAIRCHIQVDYGFGPDLNDESTKTVRGFARKDEKRLVNLLGKPIHSIWFEQQQNWTILCFENIEQKSLWSIVFEPIENDQQELSLKMSYVFKR